MLRFTRFSSANRSVKEHCGCVYSFVTPPCPCGCRNDYRRHKVSTTLFFLGQVHYYSDNDYQQY
uniref:Uncharacterized protein n=1 Tax=Aegilops tauschii subsp. strangulata TaxID=200361 RepID=A0A453MDF7_AEGTS